MHHVGRFGRDWSTLREISRDKNSKFENKKMAKDFRESQLSVIILKGLTWSKFWSKIIDRQFACEVIRVSSAPMTLVNVFSRRKVFIHQTFYLFYSFQHAPWTKKLFIPKRSGNRDGKCYFFTVDIKSEWWCDGGQSDRDRKVWKCSS